MGFLFKSKAERERERKMKFNSSKRLIERHIAENEKQFQKYRELAVRAKQTQSPQLDKIKNIMLGIRQSIAKLNELLLTLELIQQNKQQAEGMAAFASAMQVATKSMADLLQGFNPAQLSADYDLAMQQADELDEQMELVLGEIDAASAHFPAQDLSDMEQLIDDDVRRSEEDLLGGGLRSRQGERS